MIEAALSAAPSLTQERIPEFSKALAARIIGNPELLATMSQLAPKPEKLWLTTEEAAKMSGFSRPFIAAVLDSSTYVGAVNRTAKGHRRVLASEFRQWLSGLGKIEVPMTLDDIRTGMPVEAEAEPETADEKRDRLKKRRRALKTARELGLA